MILKLISLKENLHSSSFCLPMGASRLSLSLSNVKAPGQLQGKLVLSFLLGPNMNIKTSFLFSWLSSFSLLLLVMSEMLWNFQRKGWEAQGRLYGNEQVFRASETQ